MCRIRAFLLLSAIWMLTTYASPVVAGQVLDAVLSNDTGALKTLLDDGIDPDEEGVATPLYFASDRGFLEVVSLLVSAGADVNRLSKWGSPLQIAARKGHEEIVALLLKNGADPSLPGGEHRRTALHEAAWHGSPTIAKLLLDKGANANALTQEVGPAPPLHFAVLRKNHEVAELLREYGAGPTDVDPISGADLASANLDLGRERAAECSPCHLLLNVPKEEQPAVWSIAPGPILWNIVGRKKASIADFPYTPEMAAQQGVWDYEELNRFLADVLNTVPGTTMYRGSETDRATRIALIAYLRTLSDNPAPLP